MCKNFECCTDIHDTAVTEILDVCHERTDLKVFVVVIPKEGWEHVAAPILLLV